MLFGLSIHIPPRRLLYRIYFRVVLNTGLTKFSTIRCGALTGYQYFNYLRDEEVLLITSRFGDPDPIQNLGGKRVATKPADCEACQIGFEVCIFYFTLIRPRSSVIPYMPASVKCG